MRIYFFFQIGVRCFYRISTFTLNMKRNKMSENESVLHYGDLLQGLVIGPRPDNETPVNKNLVSQTW